MGGATIGSGQGGTMCPHFWGLGYRGGGVVNQNALILTYSDMQLHFFRLRQAFLRVPTIGLLPNSSPGSSGVGTGGTCPPIRPGHGIRRDPRRKFFGGGREGVLPDGPVTPVTQCRTTTIRINHL